jgi:hypothetical protein
MRRDEENPYTEEGLLKALGRLGRRWPPGYALFDWSGTLCLIHLNEDGTFPNPSVPGETNRAIVSTFGGITSGSGDPD